MVKKIFNKEIFDGLRNAICKVMTNIDADDINECSDLRDDLGMDSMDIYDATLMFEKNIKRYYPADLYTDDKILQCRTVADLVNLYESIATQPSQTSRRNGKQ